MQWGTGCALSRFVTRVEYQHNVYLEWSWVKERHITSASTPRQFEDMPDQEILASTLMALADQVHILNGWQKHQDFAAEEEVNQAFVQYLKGCGLEVTTFCHKGLYDTNGRRHTSFDGAYYTESPPTIHLVDTKYHLDASDIRTAMGKVNKLKQLLVASNTYIDDPEHDRSYRGMMALLSKFSDCEVKLVMGGCRVKDNVQQFVKAGKCLVIAPSGGGYSVVS